MANVKKWREKGGNFKKKIPPTHIWTKKETGDYEIRLNNEIKKLLGEKDIIQTLKERKISWLGRMYRDWMV